MALSYEQEDKGPGVRFKGSGERLGRRSALLNSNVR